MVQLSRIPKMLPKMLMSMLLAILSGGALSAQIADP